MSNLRRKRLKTRSFKGQCVIELVLCGLVLVPVALGLVDLSVLIIGGQLSGDLAKQAARAASVAASLNAAQAAVAAVQTNYHASNTFQSLNLQLLRFDNTAAGIVSVSCSVSVVLPASIPMLNIGPNVSIQTQHSEPIVGIVPSS